jgi:hypothetical protein
VEAVELVELREVLLASVRYALHQEAKEGVVAVGVLAQPLVKLLYLFMEGVGVMPYKWAELVSSRVVYMATVHLQLLGKVLQGIVLRGEEVVVRYYA